MKVLQIAKLQAELCGVSLFARHLQEEVRPFGVDVDTVPEMPADVEADLVLLHHHDELFDDDEVGAIAGAAAAPVVIFAHGQMTARLCAAVDGVVAMCPGMTPPGDTPVHLMPLPAWVPSALEDRAALRREFDLPADAVVVGTNGFLKFDRQWPEVAAALLQGDARVFVEILASPWRLESPGLVDRLERLGADQDGRLRLSYSFLDTKTLNRRLQACDLLWCWTAAPSRPYASGVIADQYASGTRIVACAKAQHAHVLTLPNTVGAPNDLDGFIAEVVRETRDGVRLRHDPAPIAWGCCLGGLSLFLRAVVSRRAATP